MGKRIKHRGMTLTEKEHERWHKEHPEVTPEQHEALMRRIGISEEEDREWHEKRGVPQKTTMEPGKKPINPFAIGGGFLEYCAKQGWIIKQCRGKNTNYYATKEGEEKLKKFGIKIQTE